MKAAARRVGFDLERAPRMAIAAAQLALVESSAGRINWFLQGTPMDPPLVGSADVRGDASVRFGFTHLGWSRSVCPRGKSATGLSIPPCENISLVPSGKSGALSRASRAERGALANVINAARDAVDAEALLDEQRACGRRRRVVLTPRRWRQVSRKVFARRRWQESPVTGESAL